MQGMAEGFILMSMTTARASELASRSNIKKNDHNNERGRHIKSSPFFLFESRNNTIPAFVSVF